MKMKWWMDDNSGGYCPKCDTVWASSGRCRCDPLLAKHETALNVYAKEIWNAAIEAAANVSEINSAANIRKLKM